MLNASKFSSEISRFGKALTEAKSVLITAPGAADGDSIGSQLALKRMIAARFSQCETFIVNDEPLPPRYQFLPDAQTVLTFDTFSKLGRKDIFDVAVIVDGGIDRAGRVRPIFEKAKTTVFIDHHAISCEFPYQIRIVEARASSTTELMFHLSQTELFKTSVDVDFSQQIYLGLIFDTGFFRHSNTTPEVMELGARLLRTGFDFTRVGERGMLERSFSSLKLLADTLSRAQLSKDGRIIWSTLSQDTLKSFNATSDDREGIIDHLFLTHGIEVAALFFGLPENRTKLSFRSQGSFDVAHFARTLTERGGGHTKAAGASLEMPMDKAVPWVLEKLQAGLNKK